jgi:single-strand DNA-binding protein
MNVNRVIINGNLTRDPELRATQGGTSVATLRVAVNERIKQNDEWTDRANFFDVTVWGKSAENCASYLSKGRPVLVEGRLRWEEWEAKDGSGKRQAVKIVADQVIFLRSAQDDNSGGGGEPTQAQQQQAQPVGATPADTSGMGQQPGAEDDNIPF